MVQGRVVGSRIGGPTEILPRRWIIVIDIHLDALGEDLEIFDSHTKENHCRSEERKQPKLQKSMLRVIGLYGVG